MNADVESPSEPENDSGEVAHPRPPRAPVGRSQQLIFWAFGLVAFIFILYALRAVLLPFVAGIAIAYLLDPVADWLGKKGVSRVFATVAIISSFLLVFTAAIALLAPLLQGEIIAFAERLPTYADRARELLDWAFEALRDRVPPAEMERVREAVGSLVNRVAGGILGFISAVIGGGLAFLNLVSLIFITPIVAFYIILDWDRLLGAINELLPRDHATVIRAQVKKIDRKLAGFLRGQAMVAGILGIFYAVALSVVGLDFGLVIGLMAGLASFIPFVGAVSGFIVSVAVATLQFGELVPVAIVAAIFLIGQIVEGNFLSPKLVGAQVGLHPIWIIFALLAGGALLGMLGLLLAVPTAAVISVLVEFGIERYRKSGYFLGNRS